MVKIRDFTFPSADGVHAIHCRQWLPEGDVRMAVQLVHGVAEHIRRYDAFATYLAQHGIAVTGDDHLGHGESIRDDTELGWFGEKDGWKYLVEDEKTLCDLLKEQFPAVPLVLFGHSMGSFIARTYLGSHPGDHDGCVLSGTGAQPAAVCAAGKLLAGREIKSKGSKYRSPMLQKMAFGGYLKGIENPIGANDWICRDEAVIRAYDADPLCGFTATAGLMRDMMEGLAIIGRADHMALMDKSMPVLFIAGSADPVGAWGKGVEKVAAAFQKAGMEDVTVKLYPGCRHEVLNELDKDTVWADVLAWLEKLL